MFAVAPEHFYVRGAGVTEEGKPVLPKTWAQSGGDSCSPQALFCRGLWVGGCGEATTPGENPCAPASSRRVHPCPPELARSELSRVAPSPSPPPKPRSPETSHNQMERTPYGHHFARPPGSSSQHVALPASANLAFLQFPSL